MRAMEYYKERRCVELDVAFLAEQDGKGKVLMKKGAMAIIGPNANLY